MIKRSAAILCAIGVASAGPSKFYSESDRQFLAVDDAQLNDFKSNADICSFWLDSSFYLLKPMIRANSAY
jgi:hypothetical protein